MKKIYSCLGMMLLISAHCLALSFATSTSGNWNDPTTWGMTGTPTVGVNFPGASDNVTINAGHTVNVSVAADCNNLIINVSGLVSVGNVALNVNGTISTTGGAFIQNVINTAAAGTVKFVGNTRTLFTTWGTVNLDWRCEIALNAGQTGTSPANKFGYLKVTTGTVTFTGEVRIDSTGGDGNGVVDISSGATMIIQSKITRSGSNTSFCRFINIDGTLEMSNSASGMFINASSIFINNGGTLRLRRGGITNGAASSQVGTTGTHNFQYATGSTLEYINNYTNSNNSNFLQTGAELIQSSMDGGVSGPALFNLNMDGVNDNEIQLIGNPEIFGTVTVKRASLVSTISANLAYQTGSSLKFNGAAAQNATGTSPFGRNLIVYPTQLSAGPTNLIIQNAAGVTINDDGDSHLVTGTLTFSGGKLNTPSTHPLILTETATTSGADPVAGKFINGLFQKITNTTTAFTFPIGTGATAHFITITPGTTATTTWQAQYFNANPTTVGAALQSPISGLTNTEYWDLTRVSGTSTANVTLTWSSAISGATLTDVIRVAHWNGSAWEDYGSNGAIIPGNTTSGSVTSDLKNAFSPITIGFAPLAALPVKLISFAVVKQGTVAAISWKVADPQDAKRYEIYKCGDGQNYQLLQTLAGDPSKAEFKTVDDKLLEGSNYYRLKVYDIDGSFYYSKTVVIFNNNKGIEVLGLSPNIIYNSANLSVTSSSRAQINIMISDVQGRIVQRMSKDVMAGENSINLNFTSLPSGTYQLTTTTTDGAIKTLRFMKL